MCMNTFIINNVKIVTPYYVLENAFIYVKRGIIEGIGQTSAGKVHRSCSIINGNGNWLFPGIIDLHNRLYEKDTSFYNVETALVSHGITTVCHNIAEEDTGVNDFNNFRRLGIIRHHLCANSGPCEEFTLLNASGIIKEAASSSNIKMTDIVENHPIYVICSDSETETILEAIFALNGCLGLDMVNAVRMATISPAKAFGIEKKLGSVEFGKNADLILVSSHNNIPKVEMVFVNGCRIYDPCTSSNGNAV